MATKYEQSMMDNLYWWGVPTLFRCPQQLLKSQDIALIGVPHSSGNGTTERDQHLGPRAVRNISSVQRRYHNEFKLDPWSTLNIIDAGDVPFPKANDNEDCINLIGKGSLGNQCQCIINEIKENPDWMKKCANGRLDT